MGTKKDKRINFTVDELTRQTWNEVSSELVEKRVFRNKTEIFEFMISYLGQAKYKELFELRERITAASEANMS